ncbi:MAG: DNA primase [Planctomycetota bacterium]
MNHSDDSRADVERVRDASDIVRIVGEVVDLKPKGREYVGLCPFHDDRSPSMYVVPAKQMYHCFVCQAGGDVFSFVQDYHQMTFGETLRYLAERAGVQLNERTRRRTRKDDPQAVSRSVLIEANDHAQRFFRSVLRHAEHGAAARELIERRGISSEMVDAFGLGAAPDRWDGLSLYVGNKGLDERPFHELGLFKQRDSQRDPQAGDASGHYDALRHRLTFPIRDRIGRTIAFGGRRINDEDDPKYLNSPESALFDKSATLFGLDLAQRDIRRTGRAVVAEGYTDVIACHQAGVKNVVATLGTALTHKHAAVLRQLCHTVILLFAGDDAGRRAADRAAEVFLAESIDVRIATLAGHTDAKDPDELLAREDGRATLERVFDASIDLLEYRSSRLREALEGAGPAQLESALRQEVRELARLGLHRADKLRWQFLVRRLAELTGLDATTIAQLIREGTPRQAASSVPQEQAPELAPELAPEADAVSSEAVGCLLLSPSTHRVLADASLDALTEAVRGTRLEPVLDAVAEVSADRTSPTMLHIIDVLRGRGVDAGPAVALEERLAERLRADTETARQTLDACLATLVRRASRSEEGAPSPQSAADRLLELKRLRSGEHAIDRTRLPTRPAPETHRDLPPETP